MNVGESEVLQDCMLQDCVTFLHARGGPDEQGTKVFRVYAKLLRAGNNEFIAVCVLAEIEHSIWSRPSFCFAVQKVLSLCQGRAGKVLKFIKLLRSCAARVLGQIGSCGHLPD